MRGPDHKTANNERQKMIEESSSSSSSAALTTPPSTMASANGDEEEVRLTQSLAQTNFSVLAYLTNLGVTIMDQGETDMARHLFRSALSLRSNQMEQAKALPLIHAAEAWLAQRELAAAGVVAKEEEPYAGSAVSTTKDDPRTTVLPFIHARGMNILSIPGVYSFDIATHWKLVSCLILFNLALAHHLSAVFETEKETRRLTVARALYQQCRDLLQGAATVDVSPLVDFLSLALTNNLAHSCYLLEHFDESEQYYAQIISLSPRTLVTPRDHSEEAENRVMALVGRHKTNFLLNAIVLKPPSVAKSA